MPFICPHCHADTGKRSSRIISPTFREAFYECPCGHEWKTAEGVTHYLNKPQKEENTRSALVLTSAERRQRGKTHGL